jgi:hypothetical protein
MEPLTLRRRGARVPDPESDPVGGSLTALWT